MTKLPHLRSLLLRTSHRKMSRDFTLTPITTKNDDDPLGEDLKKLKINRPMYVPPATEPPLTLDDLSEPTNCCMSGCPNCVWIEYAEKLSNVLKGSSADLQKTIMEKVQDPNMRAFLSMELRVRKLID